MQGLSRIAKIQHKLSFRMSDTYIMDNIIPFFNSSL